MKVAKGTLTASLQKLPENAQYFILTSFLGLAAGLSSVFFLFMTNFIFSKTYLYFAARSKPVFTLASFAVIMTFSLIVGLLLNVFAPDAAGSGIPEIKAAYWKEMGHVNARPALVKFIAGVLSIAGGNSLGREGPSVFVGAGTTSTFAGLLGTPRREKRSACVIGASAGLAAAFNAPMASITFVIEEIIGDINNRYLGRVVLSSVLGALVVHALIGGQPAFSLPSVERTSWLHYILVLVAAGLASVAGVIFQHMTLRWRGRLKTQKKVPRWLLPVFGGFLTWVIGVSVFLTTGKVGVFGLGYQDLSAALNNNYAWKIAGVMVGAKLLATIIGYSFGGCGGIFAPTLCIGGMAGYFVGGLAGQWLPLTPADRIILAAVGMSACLGAVVRAPLTSILIVFEMTHQFDLVPGLLLGAFISQAVARLAGHLNFYDGLLVQDGHDLHKIRPPLDLQSWQNLPVSAIYNPRPVMVRSLLDAELRSAIERFPYASFPILINGKLEGVVRRSQIEEAFLTKEQPEVHPAITCYLDQTVREIGNKFLESPANILIVLDRNDKSIRGIITLHDLIRAQAAVHQ
jgi:CIC family chloride channel protein